MQAVVTITIARHDSGSKISLSWLRSAYSPLLTPFILFWWEHPLSPLQAEALASPKPHRFSTSTSPTPLPLFRGLWSLPPRSPLQPRQPSLHLSLPQPLSVQPLPWPRASWSTTKWWWLGLGPRLACAIWLHLHPSTFSSEFFFFFFFLPQSTNRHICYRGQTLYRLRLMVMVLLLHSS